MIHQNEDATALLTNTYMRARRHAYSTVSDPLVGRKHGVAWPKAPDLREDEDMGS